MKYLSDVLHGAKIALRAMVLLFCSCVGSSIAAPTNPYTAMKTWGPPVALLFVPSQPACLRWAVEEGLKVIHPKTPVQILIEDASMEAGPGMIVFHWESPAEQGVSSALGLSRLSFNPVKLTISAADTYVQHCDVRLLAHELGHDFGLVDKDVPGDLMHWTYPTGGWRITDAERAALDRAR